tara:strand:+ start:307 stop:1104 length:798 start_codon:yes stop_codon:yes gene_type:complete
MIAVIGASFFVMFKFLTLEPKSPSDLLNDVKIGSATKRWQSAFELSKLLANKMEAFEDGLFKNQLISAYQHSVHDDERVRMYLALAMGRTGDSIYGESLQKGLNDENPATRSAAIKALGLLQYKPAVLALKNILQDKERSDAEHLTTVISLGNIGDRNVIQDLKPLLNHEEVNIRWDVALSLAKLGDTSGAAIIADLMDRSYYDLFPEVDNQEANQAIKIAIQISSGYKSEIYMEKLKVLAYEDENMEIRDTAIKMLKQVYGYQS